MRGDKLRYSIPKLYIFIRNNRDRTEPNDPKFCESILFYLFSSFSDDLSLVSYVLQQYIYLIENIPI